MLQADLTTVDLEEEAAGRPIYRECRACLKIGESSGFIDIFLDKDPPWPWSTDETLAHELARIAQVPIFGELSEKCSDVICFSCLNKLRAASQFITMVQNSDQLLKRRYLNRVDNDQNCPTLKQMLLKHGYVGNEQNSAKQIDVEQLNNVSQLNNEKRWPQPKQVQTEVNEVLLSNPMDIEIKQEVLSEEENNGWDGEDGGDKPEFLMDIKIEPEEIVDPNPIHVTVNGTIAMDQMKEMPNGCEIYYDEEYLDDYIKDEPISDEDEAGVGLPLECMLCTKRFLCLSGLKAHVVAYHSYKSVRRKTGRDSPAKPAPKQRHICSICRRCFWTLTDLLVHETSHNKFSCFGCQSKFDSFRDLTKHRPGCQACNVQKPQVKTLKDSLRCIDEAFSSIRREQSRREKEVFMQRLRRGSKPDSMKEKKQKRRQNKKSDLIVRPVPTEVLVRKSLVACTKCPEKFTDKHYLNIHEQTHHSSSKTQTDNDDVVCKSKIQEKKHLESEERDREEEIESRRTHENKIKEDGQKDNKIDSKRRTEENPSVEDGVKDNNKIETGSLELEMLKIHEGTDSSNSKENIESQNKGPDDETANDNIATDKPLNNDEEPDKINEIVIEVNVIKNVSDSKNVEEKIENTVKIEEVGTMDNEAKDGTNVNKNDDLTSKLGPVEDIEGAQKNMIEIEIDTTRRLKGNMKQELDDTFQCTMMQTDSY